MDVMTLAIAFVAIAGPSILALVLYWRNNPDRRRSWRRAAEDAADTDPEHFRRRVRSGCSSWVRAIAAEAAGATAAVPANRMRSSLLGYWHQAWPTSGSATWSGARWCWSAWP